jgi:hypothetical protein
MIRPTYPLRRMNSRRLLSRPLNTGYGPGNERGHRLQRRLK